MPTYTPADLQHFIDQQGVAAELVFPTQETPTVPAAAEAMGCDVNQIIKSVLFQVNDQPPAPPRPVLVIACGTARIDYRALATRFGVGRKQVRLAPADEVLTTLGYPAGGVPPFGHHQTVLALMDTTVVGQGVVYAGGGDDRSLVRLTVAELQRVTGAEVLQVSLAPDGEKEPL